MELLIVVAIVGLIASIGVPVLVRALKKSSRAAVGTSMRDMHVAMTRYYTDNGYFPTLDPTTFEPLISEGYLTSADVLLSKVQGNAVAKYVDLGTDSWWLVVIPERDPESYIYVGTVDVTGLSGRTIYEGVYWWHPTETPDGLVRMDGTT